MGIETVSSNIVVTGEATTNAPVKTGMPRLIEVPLALLALLAFSPLISLAALAILITSRGSILFRQSRVGQGNRLFTLYKLRTMRAGSAGMQLTARGDARVTRVGKLLRKTKLDEAPELWNVLRGDMALVGPRPEVPHYVDPKNLKWRIVLQARPGITDPVTLRLRNEEALLADVSGDRESFYREILQPFKLEGYVLYLQGRSCLMDLRVLWETALAVIFPATTRSPTAEELKASATDRGVVESLRDSKATAQKILANSSL